MATTSSINVQPCKVESSELHNTRKKVLDYVRPELSYKNEQVIFSDRSLGDELAQIKEAYKSAKGRKLHAKATPLREGVIVISEDTTMEQLIDFAENCEARWGLKPLQIYMHKDEGHWKTVGEEKVWKPNLHAHIVWRWCDEIGVTRKLDKQDMAEMQTLLADCLEMKRGKSSDKKHLNSVQYKVQAEEERLNEARKELESTQTRKTIEEEERSEIRQDLEQLEGEMEKALKPTEEVHLRNWEEITEENTKRYLGGMLKGKTNYEAVAEELWRQQKERGTTIARNDYIDVRKYKDERDNAIRAKQKAENDLNTLRHQFQELKEKTIQSLGSKFSKFWEDFKRWSQDILMAVGLWGGETWENRQKAEEYTADKDRCLLLINGESLDERTAKLQEKAQKVYDRAVETSGKEWTDYRFRKFNNKDLINDYHDIMSELDDIARTAERGKRRGMRL